MPKLKSQVIKGPKARRPKASETSPTAISGEIPTFSYGPLPDSGSYIRLLNILDFDETRPISVRCELTTWPMSEVPKYHAISYAWGEANHTTSILVNGQRMQVRRNCEYTLRQATWYGGDFRSRYYWVDAICIDQSRNEEKGPQVTLMGQIYSKAECVLACVGEDDATSRYLYRQARKETSFFRELGRVAEDHDYIPRLVELLNPTEAAALNRLYWAARDFINRLYFCRLWVYQELSLGRQVLVCCGEWHLSIRVFRGLQIARPDSWIPVKKAKGRKLDLMQLWYLMQNSLNPFWNGEAGLEATFALLQAGTLDPEPTTLWAALNRVARLKCADPRDRVYGVLSTVDWSEKDQIRPDYTKDRLEVAIEALKILSSDAELGGEWITAVEFVLEILNLFDDVTPRLREAIERRRLDLPEQPANTSQEQWRGFLYYRGWRLKEEHWMRTDGEYVISDLEDDLFSSWARKPGNLPSVARPGDWFLERYGDEYSPQLIARPRAEGRIDIVGTASIKSRPVHVWATPTGSFFFRVYMDAEDAIVLHYVDHLPRRIETRFYGHPGSSYAVKGREIVPR